MSARRRSTTRARPARRCVAAVALVALATASIACGPGDGIAQPADPAPPTGAARPTTTAGRPPERFAGYSDPVYGRGTNWLCGPKAAASDRCLVANQDTTIVRADGGAQVRASDPAPDPAFDCFYVYPAFGFGGDIDTAMDRDTSTEDTLVFEQAARLRRHCRVYAPLFRQTGLMGDATVSYGDVHNAFRHYMSLFNGGRRLVLFGNGEGADHLTRLLQDEVDGDPELRSQLIAAYLVGGHVDVPAGGARVGATFSTIPTCASPTETGCVVAFSLSTPSTPRDVAARWGAAPAGRTRACVNPASPGGGAAPLTPILPVDAAPPQPGVDVGTPFVELPGILTAECVTNGPVTTLVVRPSPGDPRPPGGLLEEVPAWGLHLRAVSLALGSIMDLLAHQAGTAG